MQRVDVPLPGREYPIYIGKDLRHRVDIYAKYLREKVAIVTNTVVAPLYLADIQSYLREHGVDSIAVVLPDGEQYKDWTSLNKIFDALLENRCERSTPLLALGGGVVGDTTGFAAACYQRGAPFIQLPTTLLSQVDSSVGGKTAINHPIGKNMIGAFYQPKCVVIDTTTLDSLPSREFSSGLAEVIKYGLIRDPGFFDWLEGHIDQILARDTEAVTEAITRSCRNKAEIVVADETEQGERALLNLGHTFGHAIETGLGYGVWLHGEAVAAGCMMAAELSRRLGWLSQTDVRRIESLFQRAGLPVNGPSTLAGSAYLELMAHDKKVQGGKMRLVLLKQIGKGVIYADSPKDEIVAAIMERTG